MGFLGGLIGAAVQGVGGGLRGQNEGDELLYQHRREEEADALRRFVAQRQMATEEREARYADAQIKHMGAQDAHLAVGDDTWHPHTMQEQIDVNLGSNPQRYERPAPVNIDPNGAEAFARRKALAEFEAGLPGRTRARTPGGAHADQIKDLNQVLDDKDKEVGRAERAVMPPWDGMMAGNFPDSSAYMNDVRAPTVARAKNARDEYDRFGAVRDSLVAVDHGINLGGPGKGEPRSVTPGTAVLHSPAHGAGGAIAPRPQPSGPPASSRVMSAPAHGAGGARAAAGAPAAPTLAPEATAQIADLQRQYNEALQWRGPNGERKDPQALAQRYLEAIQQLTGGQRQ